MADIRIPDFLKFLIGSINSNDDLKSLTVPWVELYDLKEYFELEFNTKNINYVNPIYCIYTVFFIKSIKKQNPQFLFKSKIYVYNAYIYKLAKYIFYIESPAAQVELILVNPDGSKISEYFNS